jgi:8-oxo-dGTP pyrophosphatase MutT (NUDIX family)
MKSAVKIYIKNNKTNKFLFVLRDKNKSIPQSNRWSLLGGGMDANETPLKALKRELTEEVNIKITKIRLIEKKILSYKLNNEIHTFLGYMFYGETDKPLSQIKLFEGQRLKYMSIDEVLKKKNIDTVMRKYLEDSKFRRVLEKSHS